ncbi:MAG: endonuclease/exonuclease/phosphatase family protein [Phycisphaerales bacterium]
MPTVLAWNLRHGGGSRRMAPIALQLLEHAADVFILSEFRWRTGGQIAGILADHGWPHQTATEAPEGQNALLIASRTPLVGAGGGPSTPGGPALCDHAAAVGRRMAEVCLPTLGLSLAAVHIPCPGRGLGRGAVFQAVIAAARRRRSESFLLMGDFNAGRHRLDEDGTTFAGTRCLGQLAAMGYRDAWRDRHPCATDRSWYSHAGAGFRIDHAMVSAPLAARVRRCWYSHAERERGLSDHSAIAIEIE